MLRWLNNFLHESLLLFPVIKGQVTTKLFHDWFEKYFYQWWQIIICIIFDSKDVEEFLRVMVLKVMIWVLAKGWVNKTACTLRNEWDKL